MMKTIKHLIVICLCLMLLPVSLLAEIEKMERNDILYDPGWTLFGTWVGKQKGGGKWIGRNFDSDLLPKKGQEVTIIKDRIDFYSYTNIYKKEGKLLKGTEIRILDVLWKKTAGGNNFWKIWIKYSRIPPAGEEIAAKVQKPMPKNPIKKDPELSNKTEIQEKTLGKGLVSIGDNWISLGGMAEKYFASHIVEGTLVQSKNRVPRLGEVISLTRNIEIGELFTDKKGGYEFEGFDAFLGEGTELIVRNLIFPEEGKSYYYLQFELRDDLVSEGNSWCYLGEIKHNNDQKSPLRWIEGPSFGNKKQIPVRDDLLITNRDDTTGILFVNREEGGHLFIPTGEDLKKGIQVKVLDIYSEDGQYWIKVAKVLEESEPELEDLGDNWIHFGNFSDYRYLIPEKRATVAFDADMIVGNLSIDMSSEARFTPAKVALRKGTKVVLDYFYRDNKDQLYAYCELVSKSEPLSSQVSTEKKEVPSKTSPLQTSLFPGEKSSFEKNLPKWEGRKGMFFAGTWRDFIGGGRWVGKVNFDFSLNQYPRKEDLLFIKNAVYIFLFQTEEELIAAKDSRSPLNAFGTIFPARNVLKVTKVFHDKKSFGNTRNIWMYCEEVDVSQQRWMIYAQWQDIEVGRSKWIDYGLFEGPVENPPPIGQRKVLLDNTDLYYCPVGLDLLDQVKRGAYRIGTEVEIMESVVKISGSKINWDRRGVIWVRVKPLRQLDLAKEFFSINQGGWVFYGQRKVVKDGKIDWVNLNFDSSLSTKNPIKYPQVGQEGILTANANSCFYPVGRKGSKLVKKGKLPTGTRLKFSAVLPEKPEERSESNIWVKYDKEGLLELGDGKIPTISSASRKTFPTIKKGYIEGDWSYIGEWRGDPGGSGKWRDDQIYFELSSEQYPLVGQIIVVAQGVNIRTKPSTNHLEIKKFLESGRSVKVLEISATESRRNPGNYYIWIRHEPASTLNSSLKGQDKEQEQPKSIEAKMSYFAFVGIWIKGNLPGQGKWFTGSNFNTYQGRLPREGDIVTVSERNNTVGSWSRLPRPGEDLEGIKPPEKVLRTGQKVKVVQVYFLDGSIENSHKVWIKFREIEGE